MAHKTIDVERTTAADVQDVWRLLADSSTWPTWTRIEEHVAEQPGGPDGTGEIRVFKTGRHAVREEIVERRPLERLSYTVLGGLAVRDYRADIDLRPLPDGGTRIRWRTAFRARVPGFGWLYRSALDRATRQFVEGLAEHASRRRSALAGPARASG